MKHSRKVLVLLAFGLLLFCITLVGCALNAEQIAEKTLAATVSLEMTDRNGRTIGWGSGFFVGQNQIATNFHVIAGGTGGTAKLVDKPTRYAIKNVIAIDQDNDLAILEVTPRGIHPLPLGDSDAAKRGQTVYVAGTPQKLPGTFSDGMISNIHKSDKLLQMTAPISPGSSGGPVVNKKVEVIGIATMFKEGGQNLNFAIPSNSLKRLLERSEWEEPLPQEKQPLSAETYNKRGRMMDSIELYYEAIVEYSEAIRLNPDFASAYSNRGAAKHKLGRYDEAIEDYDRAIKLDPAFASAYNNRGAAKSWLGRYDEAIEDYDRAIKLDPAFAAAYRGRGVAKADLGRYDEAIEDFDRAISLDPNNARAYFHRGVTKHMTERDSAAKEDLQKALILAEQAGDETLKTKIEERLKQID